MKIKSIKLENNEILGDIFLDFTDCDGSISNSIILAGENGTGKSTILNIIYEFSNLDNINKLSEEKREIIIKLSNEEIEFLKNNINSKEHFQNEILENELIFNFDFSMKGYWDKINIKYKDSSGNFARLASYIFGDEEVKSVLKSIFSDAEINYSPENINSVTAKNVDEKIIKSIKSSPTLATEITQLLIDVQALDDEEFSRWGRNNIGNQIDKNMIDIRMRRFKDAFQYIFPQKRLKSVNNESGCKKVIFEECGKCMPIENLSTGEKQIVFRGSFLLKNQKSNKGILALIDEPELSLHPNWQLKIINFYKMLFTDEGGIQTSQLFFVTHSPFIIHNNSRSNDKVIILKKDNNGKIFIPMNSEYYSWTDEKLISEAFNINLIRERIIEKCNNVIITEGKTDWKHFKAALTKFKSQGKFEDIDIEFEEYENLKMGDSNLESLLKNLAKIRHPYKIIGIFDSDEKVGRGYDKDYPHEFGNNIYGWCIPKPDFRQSMSGICVEFLYKDRDIMTKDKHGRRLFLTSEFNDKGKHKSEFGVRVLNLKDIKHYLDEKMCKIKDSDVVDEDDNSIALSKNNFAENIMNNVSPFNNMDFSEFEPVFERIRTILNKQH